MRDPDDARYDALLCGLQLGAPPSWVRPEEQARLQQLADGHRLAIATTLGLSFPNASYYGRALYGVGLLDAVAAELVALPAYDEPLDAKVRAAALTWSRGIDRRDLTDLFEHDRMLASETDGDVVFGHDILGFVVLLERLRRRYAPDEIVRTYAPAAQVQRVMFYREAGVRRVREIVSRGRSVA